MFCEFILTCSRFIPFKHFWMLFFPLFQLLIFWFKNPHAWASLRGLTDRGQAATWSFVQGFGFDTTAPPINDLRWVERRTRATPLPLKLPVGLTWQLFAFPLLLLRYLKMSLPPEKALRLRGELFPLGMSLDQRIAACKPGEPRCQYSYCFLK